MKFSKIFKKSLQRIATVVYHVSIRDVVEKYYVVFESLCFEICCTNTCFLKSVFCNLKFALLLETIQISRSKIFN